VFLKKIRLQIANILLQQKTVRMKRQKKLFDFASAHFVGVLCSPHDELSTVYLKNFLNYLSRKGIKYSVFGYFDEKNIPDNFLYWKGIDFITRDDLNFFFIPQNPIVDKFINEPFDMLINCTIDHYFPVEYIAQLSKASCKVGIMRDDKSNYDLMIDIQKNRNIEYFLDNLEKYLFNLKNPQLEQT